MLFLSDADISKYLTMEEAIETVEQAFQEYAKGNVVLPTRSTIMIGKHNGSISFMPSYLTELEAQATKIISIYPNNKKKTKTHKKIIIFFKWEVLLFAYKLFY